MGDEVAMKAHAPYDHFHPKFCPFLDNKCGNSTEPNFQIKAVLSQSLRKIPDSTSLPGRIQKRLAYPMRLTGQKGKEHTLLWKFTQNVSQDVNRLATDTKRWLHIDKNNILSFTFLQTAQIQLRASIHYVQSQASFTHNLSHHSQYEHNQSQYSSLPRRYQEI